jgi:predicted lipid-binding transport protein (Tim44 family)
MSGHTGFAPEQRYPVACAAAPPHDAGPPPFAVDAQAAPAGDLRAADAALAPAATDLRTLSLPGTPGALYGGCAVGAAAHGAARGGAATALAFVLLLLAASIARLTPAQRGRTRRSRRNACARDACSRRASRDMLGGCPKT